VRGFVDFWVRILRTWIGQTALLALDLLSLALTVASLWVPGFAFARGITAFVLVLSFLWTAYKLESAVQSRLAAYEDQAPDYEVRVTKTLAGAIRSHMWVSVILGFENRSPWPGTLTAVNLDKVTSLGADVEWSVTEFGWSAAGRYSGMMSLPRQLPQPKCGLLVAINAAIGGSLDSVEREQWASVVIPLRLLVEYYTQPVGLVQTLLATDVTVDLREQFDSVVSSKIE